MTGFDPVTVLISNVEYKVCCVDHKSLQYVFQSLLKVQAPALST